MIREEIGSVVGGLVGGAIATAAIQKGLQLSAKIPEPVRPPATTQDPGEFLTEELEARRGEPLSPTTHHRVARGLHWTYGIGWSTLLALLGPVLHLERPGRAAVAGAALGTTVWAVGYAGWLPAVGLTKPIHKQKITRSLSGLLAHVAFGVLAALPIHLANRVVARPG